MSTKITLFIFFSICIFIPLKGQITLTESNTPHNPNITEVRFLTNVPVVDFEIEGENIDYDFSSITPGFMFTDEYFSPIRPEFLDATRYEVTRSVFGPLDLFSEYYTVKSEEGIAEVGTYKTQQAVSLAPLTGNTDDELVFLGNATVFEMPNYEIIFPTTYGSAWTSNTEIVFDFNVTIGAFGLDNVPGRSVSYIEHQYEAAGWGRITIPTLSGPSIPYDVLVVKQGSSFIDSVFLAGAPAPTALLNGLGLTQGAPGVQNSYAFYAENIENPVMLLVMSDDWQTIEEAQYLRDGLQVASSYVYVDAKATGANNGSSWANAYTSLATALDNASPNDEIWVAEGTYVPEVPSISPNPTKRMFLLWQDVQLYGGFNGTETERSERNPKLYETILTGDINGDDVSNDFSVNRSDNVENVIYGNNTISTACVLDGFTISGGHADGDPSVLTDIRGAGLFTFGPLQINNCIFKDNFAQDHGGGAYYRDAAAAGGKVINCDFQRNETGVNGGGLFVAFIPDDGVEVDSCRFSENIAGDTGGGFISVNSHVNIKNSFFTNNTAVIGPGGGMSISNGLNPILSNCRFSGNSSTQGGGAIMTLLTSNQSAIVENCTFNGNISTGGSGGGLTCQSTEQNNNYDIQGCTFIGNMAESAISTGGGLDVAYGNFAGGGASFITDCTIINNTVTGSGGGVSLRDQAFGDNHMEIRNCEINGNAADFNAGGLLFYKASASNSSIKISQSRLTNNQSVEALGMGLSSISSLVPDQDIVIDNCVLAGHTGQNNASAAILIQNISATLINNTIIGESPAFMSKDNAEVKLGNNILFTPNFSSVVASGAPSTIVSLGGNLFSDGAASNWAVLQDQQNTDPLFVTGMTDLSENSPAIDKGILPDEVADFDVNGNARIQGSCIDIGASESTFDANLTSCLTLTNIKEEIVSADAIDLFPNPVNSTSQIKLDNEWRGNISVRIVNAFGQILQNYTLTKYNDIEFWDLNAQNLQNGTYQIILSNGEQLMTKAFIVMI